MSRQVSSMSTPMPVLHRLCDWATAVLIYFALVFGPWAFGTTQAWSIAVMKGVGFALGLLWLGKLALRQVSGCRPARWDHLPRLSRNSRAARLCTQMLGVATLLVLLYCLMSSVNARPTYRPDLWRFEYHHAIAWLPHSYDRERSWRIFWEYL